VDEPQWLDDPRFATDELRGQHGAELSARMQAWCAQRTTAEALEQLAAASIPAGPVLSPREVLEHPQVRAMDLFTPMGVPGANGTVPWMRVPVDLSATPGTIGSAPPAAGEHSAEVLRELGFTAAEIHALMA